MPKSIQLGTFQIGTPMHPDDGLRIAVTRRPPRGIPKSAWKSVGQFDVWFPALAPSAELLERFHPQRESDPKLWKRFLGAYEKELLSSAESRQTLALIQEIAARMPVSIGCFCADESRCHRSRLREVLLRAT
jgi:uncharacterized protein YeaO (DUF488 family)